MNIIRHCRNIGIALVASTILVLPIQTDAATFLSDDTISIDQVESNLYAAGETIDINATIEDDLVVAGQDITINDTITGSLFAAGQSITVDGQVNGNTRIAGNKITLSGDFQGDVLIGAEKVILDNAQILGDLVVGSTKIEITGNTRVNGDSYVSADIDRAEIVAITEGDVNFEEFEEKEVSTQDRLIRGAQSLIGFLVIMITIIWVLFSKKRLWTPSVAINLNLVVHLVVGLLSFVVTGVVLVISAILSFPTGFVAFLLLLLNLLMFSLSIWYIPVYVTNIASNTLEKAWPSQRPWLSVLGVWLMLVILTIIAPFTGFLSVLIGLFFTIMALSTYGFILSSLYRALQTYLREPRQKTYTTEEPIEPEVVKKKKKK